MTIHGTAIDAAPLTPLAPPQLIGIYGSPMECLDIYVNVCSMHEEAGFLVGDAFSPGGFGHLAFQEIVWQICGGSSFVYEKTTSSPNREDALKLSDPIFVFFQSF